MAELLLAGEADIGVATEALTNYPDLATLPCYQWTHLVIVPSDHALAREADSGQAPTLARLAEFPIITYEPGYTGRSHIDEACRRTGVTLNMVLQAMDADVIKTYVGLGMGVGLIAAIAFDEIRDSPLRALDARHLFQPNLTRLALRRGSFLRSYVYEFIRAFAPPLTPEVVGRALGRAAGAAHDDDALQDAAPAQPMRMAANASATAPGLVPA